MLPLGHDTAVRCGWTAAAGIHLATWGEVTTRFGNTPWRRQLLYGLGMAINSLRRAGCRTVYIDGSFVTSKEIPNDFDACWEEGVVPETSGLGAAAVRWRQGSPEG